MLGDVHFKEVPHQQGIGPAETITWFLADVHLYKVETDERRVYRSEEAEFDGEWSPYIWEDGNYRCDCNRALFFARAAAEPTPDDPCDSPCGDGGYIVERIVRRLDGEVLYEEPLPSEFSKPLASRRS
jgi:hypothetical protein